MSKKKNKEVQEIEEIDFTEESLDSEVEELDEDQNHPSGFFAGSHSQILYAEEEEAQPELEVLSEPEPEVLEEPVAAPPAQNSGAMQTQAKLGKILRAEKKGGLKKYFPGRTRH